MTKAAGKGEGNHPHDCFTTGDFKKGKRLGSGAFSTVYLGRCAHPRDPRVEQGHMYAVKQIVQKSLTPEDRAGLKQEIEILKELDSDLVMKLFAVYENKKFFQLVTELVEGGLLKKTILREGKGDHPPNDGSHTMISPHPCCCWPCPSPRWLSLRWRA